MYSTISNFQYILEKTRQLSTNQRQEIISCVLLWLKQFHSNSDLDSIALKAFMVLSSLILQKPFQKNIVFFVCWKTIFLFIYNHLTQSQLKYEVSNKWQIKLLEIPPSVQKQTNDMHQGIRHRRRQYAPSTCFCHHSMRGFASLTCLSHSARFIKFSGKK